MTSHLSDDFIGYFKNLPGRVQQTAQKNYKLWKNNSAHPSLDFKRIGKRLNIYSVRIGLGWRALGIVENDSIIWFWIGSHAEYNKLLKSM